MTVVPSCRQPYRSPGGRRVTAGCLLCVFGTLAAFPATASAQTAFTVPALPLDLPLVHTIDSDWTVTIGVKGVMSPTFFGAKDYALSPSPILSVRRAGSPTQFTSERDSPSIALLDFGRFRAGPALNFEPGRSSSDDKVLKGLHKVGASVQLGAFAEYYPVDWFRTRLEVRNGLGAETGLSGDLSADAIIPLTERLILSGGPRVSLQDAQALSPYFNVDAAESFASGLPIYRIKGNTTSAGVGGQISYKLTPQWELRGYVEYERVLNGIASSPLVKLRGSPDQLTVGLGLSYEFDVKVR